MVEMHADVEQVQTPIRTAIMHDALIWDFKKGLGDADSREQEIEWTQAAEDDAAKELRNVQKMVWDPAFEKAVGVSHFEHWAPPSESFDAFDLIRLHRHRLHKCPAFVRSEWPGLGHVREGPRERGTGARQKTNPGDAGTRLQGPQEKHPGFVPFHTPPPFTASSPRL